MAQLSMESTADAVEPMVSLAASPERDQDLDTSSINVFDTSICSDNVGDTIIMDSAYEVLAELFPDSHMEFLPTHNHRGPYRNISTKTRQLGFVGGSNILSQYMLFAHNWRLTPNDFRVLRNLVLLGTGWSSYNTKLRPGTAYFYKKVLSSRHLHSVRDMHTYEALLTVIPNVVYTACPTMWKLTPEHCAGVPKHKSKNVIMALTFYKPNPETDLAMYRLLRKHYETIYFWPQQLEDAEYARALGMTGLRMLGPVLGHYNRVLQEEDVDVVGSRLHGGIRALQLKRRALIVAVDNRAREMGKTTNLGVVERDQLDAMEQWIQGGTETRILLPTESIARWKHQFRAS